MSVPKAGPTPRHVLPYVTFLAAGAFILFTAPADAGTLELPELTDPENDVEYGAAYVGPKDRGHIDILAAWFAFDKANDNVTLTIKLTSFEGFANATDWRPVAVMQANVTIADEPVGHLTWDIAKETGDADVQSELSWRRSLGASQSIAHSLSYSHGSPAYVTFHIPRPALAQLGETITDVGGYFVEGYRPQGTALPTGVVVSNRDDAQSTSQFTIQLFPSSTGRGGNEGAPEATAPSNSEGTGEPTPIPLGASVIALGLGAAWIRAAGTRRRR